jgi:DNA-directed RNA polymerase subunit RPC12/RpoP
MRLAANYLCLKCEHKWSESAGPTAFLKPGQEHPDPTQCPKCGHLYIKWLNYNKPSGPITYTIENGANVWGIT